MPKGDKSPGKDVNLKVDNRVMLEDIIPPSGNPGTRRVCALKIDGVCSVVAELSDLRARKKSDYKKILKVIRLISENSARPEIHYKRGNAPYQDVFEMRGGQIRLFFFMHPSSGDIVICSNIYWKAKSSHKEQDQAFKICQVAKQFYYDYCRTTSK